MERIRDRLVVVCGVGVMALAWAVRVEWALIPRQTSFSNLVSSIMEWAWRWGGERAGKSKKVGF